MVAWSIAGQGLKMKHVSFELQVGNGTLNSTWVIQLSFFQRYCFFCIHTLPQQQLSNQFHFSAAPGPMSPCSTMEWMAILSMPWIRWARCITCTNRQHNKPSTHLITDPQCMPSRWQRDWLVRARTGFVPGGREYGNSIPLMSYLGVSHFNKVRADMTGNVQSFQLCVGSKRRGRKYVTLTYFSSLQFSGLFTIVIFVLFLVHLPLLFIYLMVLTEEVQAPNIHIW